MHRALGRRYRIFREVGAGPHAQVYLALSFQRPGVAEEVALKVWGGVADSAATDFLDGAVAVARLSHPNLVRVREFGAQDGTAWLAMEYVDGWNLASLLAELRKTDERMPLRHVLTIGMALCRGLHAAHTAVDHEARPLRLVHGAIKPSNVLICRDGAVKLGDFAVASPRAAESLAMADYLAPEQVSGVVVDERADVYALGVLLHELASGSHVHFALPGLHAADRRAFARPRLLQLRPDAPPRLDTAIAHALEFAPTDRFGSCRELLRELGAVLEQDLPLDGATGGVLGDWAEGVRHLSRVVAPVHRKT
jgi:serine/threonine-protein kinase